MIKISAKIAKSFKADFRMCMKEALQTAIKNWHKDTLPGHFQEGAAAKYGYAPRSDTASKNGRRKGYAEKKRRKGLPPLVWSGATRVLSTRHITVSGTAQSARGAMDVPFYISQKKAGHPDMVAELTAVTPEEERQMAEFIERTVATRMTYLRGDMYEDLNGQWKPEFQVA